METIKLYRPVGLKELELIIQSDFKKFPPRLDWQPIFYPVLNFEYAKEIAIKWNVDDQSSDYSGFVTEFEVNKEYIDKFEIQNVGDKQHNELWIPSEELEDFNRNIVNSIEVSYKKFGKKYYGIINHTKNLNGLNFSEQFDKLKSIVLNKTFIDELVEIVKVEKVAIYVNFGFWFAYDIDDEVLPIIADIWNKLNPNIKL